MALTLLAGPANAGKVALLLERYLAVLSDEPFLIVPNRSDVDRVERELLTECGALMSGQIGTFDELFERLAREGGEHRPVTTDAQRAALQASYAEMLNSNGYPIRMQSIASAPPDRKGWLEGEHYVNGSSGPRIVIRVDLVPSGELVRVEVRMTAYP